MSDTIDSPDSGKGAKEKKKSSALENAGLAGSVAENVQRYGSAAKEHIVSYGGVDNETGETLSRSLKKVSDYKINPNNKNANLRQQAGFSAEIKETARSNAEKIISGDKTRKIRTDDMGRVNDPLADHMEVDKTGNINPGSATQMKFVGSNYKQAFGKLMSKDYQKYIDNDVPFEVPEDYFNGIKEEAKNKITKLEKQVNALEAKGEAGLAKIKREEIEKVKKIHDNLKKSKVSNRDAMEARRSPMLSTAKDIGKISHRSGVAAAKTGAAIGGGISVIRNLVALVKGEKKAEEALVDTATDTAKAALVSYGSAFAGSSLKAVMQNASGGLMRTLSKTNLPGTVVATVLETGKTLSKYINGEIDGTECLEELGEKGTGMLSSAMFAVQGARLGTFLIPIPGVGTVAGGLVGGMLGYAFSSTYYKQLLGVLKGEKIAREERLRIESECEEAVRAISEYRAELERLINEYLTEYKDTLNLALNEMSEAYESGDADGFIAGANRITRKLGGSPQYETAEEFRKLLMQGAVFKM